MTDWKPARRVKDPDALRAAVLREPRCVMCRCESTDPHHILPKGRTQTGDDVAANLAGVCALCHRQLHNANPLALTVMGEYVRGHRPDTVEYLNAKLVEGAESYLTRRYG